MSDLTAGGQPHNPPSSPTRTLRHEGGRDLKCVGKTAPVYVLAVAFTLVGVGCSSKSPSTESKSAKSAATSTAERPSEPPPIFVDWPTEKPTATLVLTGEMLGHLRPCGCSPDQHGGLAHRGGLLEYLKKEKGWNPVPLDLGDIIGKVQPWEMERFRAALNSMQQLGYQVIAVGRKDLALDSDFLVGEAINSEPTKFLAANLRFSDEARQGLLSSAVEKIRILSSGDCKIGVTAVLSPSLRDENFEKGLEITPPTSVLPEIVTAMKKQNIELKVLLAQAPLDEAYTIAEKFQEKDLTFDLIVCLSKAEDSANQEAKMVGSTMVTWVGQKGKSAGIVGYWRDKKPRLRFELAPLDKRFPDMPSMSAIYADYVKKLKDGDYLSKFPRLPPPAGDHFVGAQECGRCHKKAYAKWETTKHAHALESLVKAKPAFQDHNPECVACHTTGFEYKGGFRTPETTPQFAGNQCENCHGPGGKHSADPKNVEWLTAIRKSQHTISATCVKCHDQDNSVHFNFQTYWPKVEHRGKD